MIPQCFTEYEPTHGSSAPRTTAAAKPRYLRAAPGPLPLPPTAPFALSAPGLRPARGGAGGAAGLGRACAVGPGKWPRTVCAAAAAAWGHKWSLPPAPQVGAADGRTGGRATGREGKKEGGKKGGRRGGRVPRPDYSLHPRPSLPCRRSPRQGFLWESPVAFRWPLTPAGEGSGLACSAPPVGAGKGHPGGLRPGLREVPGGLGRPWRPQRAPAATSLLLPLAPCCRRRDLQRQDAGRRQLLGVQAPAGACWSLSGCVTNVKAKHQGYVVLGFVLPRSCPNGYRHVSTGVNVGPGLYTHVVFAHCAQSSRVKCLRLGVLKGPSLPLMQGVESPVGDGDLQWSWCTSVPASPKAEGCWPRPGSLFVMEACPGPESPGLANKA